MEPLDLPPLIPDPRPLTPACFHLDFPLRGEVVSCPVEWGAPAIRPGAAMSVGKPVVCEPDGPLGTVIPEGRCVLEADALRERTLISVLRPLFRWTGFEFKGCYAETM